MRTCHCPTEPHFSHCGRYGPTLDYTFLPNSLSEEVALAKVSGMHKDDILDHVPVQLSE